MARRPIRTIFILAVMFLSLEVRGARTSTARTSMTAEMTKDIADHQNYAAHRSLLADALTSPDSSLVGSELEHTDAVVFRTAKRKLPPAAPPPFQPADLGTPPPSYPPSAAPAPPSTPPDSPLVPPSTPPRPPRKPVKAPRAPPPSPANPLSPLKAPLPPKPPKPPKPPQPPKPPKPPASPKPPPPLPPPPSPRPPPPAPPPPRLPSPPPPPSLPPSPYPEPYAYLPLLRPDAILNAHNKYRVLSGVPNLTWSDDLAAVAQRWSDQCIFEHSGGPYGENLVMGWFSNMAQILYGMSLWTNEMCVYDFDAPGWSEKTGHYTQVVWKGTTKVGCGFKPCTSVVGYGPCKGCGVVTCEYYPPGNYWSTSLFRANVFKPSESWCANGTFG